MNLFKISGSCDKSFRIDCKVSLIFFPVLKSITYSLTSNLTKFNVKNSDAVVTVTKAHEKIIQEYDNTKTVRVIPNGVDNDIFRPIPKNVALMKLKLEHFLDKTVLIYFGSIDPWLDFVPVFRAMKNLERKGLDVVLFIVGFCHGMVRKSNNAP